MFLSHLEVTYVSVDYDIFMAEKHCKYLKESHLILI